MLARLRYLAATSLLSGILISELLSDVNVAYAQTSPVKTSLQRSIEDQVKHLVSGLDQRPVFFDGHGKPYQISVEENDLRLFETGPSKAPVGTVHFDRPISGLKDYSAQPGWRYFAGQRDTVLAWFYEDGKTVLLSFVLRAGQAQSTTVTIDEEIFPIGYPDGSIGGFAGSPWRLWFRVATLGKNGLVAASSDMFQPQGAATNVIGSIVTDRDGQTIKTTAFTNWSDSDTRYITLASSDGSSKILNHGADFAPIALLPTGDLLMLDASGCFAEPPASSGRQSLSCSSDIVAVAIPDGGGTLDMTSKRILLNFPVGEILLATTRSLALRDDSAIALVGDTVFAISRAEGVPHLRWALASNPTVGGQIDLGLIAGDDVAFVDKDIHSGKLILTADGLLSPIRFVSIAVSADGDIPVVESAIALRPPTFDGEAFAAETLGVQENGIATSIIVTRKHLGRDARCNGRALVEVYGGYGTATRPSYLTSYGPLWLEKGNSYVSAHVRGGGDLGENGYRQGSGDAFGAAADDVAALARKLKKRGCSSVIVSGFSHGGNVAALAALRDPAAIDRAIIEAAPLDLARGLNAKTFATDEYPVFADDAARNRFLKRASPLETLRDFADKRHKPELLLFYGARDAVVPPYHGEAFAEAARKIGLPVQLLVDPDLGHGPPTSVEGYANRTAHKLLFMQLAP